MKKIALLFFVLSASILFAQAPQVGTKAWTDLQQRNSNPACVPVPVSAGFNSLSNLAYTTMIGVNENVSLENSFVLSPNPGNGNFQLSLSLLHAQEIQVVVYDQLGRNVYSQNENANAGMFSSTMNLSSLSSGVYSVQLKTAQGFATRRLVIN